MLAVYLSCRIYSSISFTAVRFVQFRENTLTKHGLCIISLHINKRNVKVEIKPVILTLYYNVSSNDVKNLLVDNGHE